MREELRGTGHVNDVDGFAVIEREGLIFIYRDGRMMFLLGGAASPTQVFATVRGLRTRGENAARASEALSLAGGLLSTRGKAWVRSCQACGHRQPDVEPAAFRAVRTTYHDKPCDRCGATALDYGSWQVNGNVLAGDADR